jgi:hypothetical protein
MGATAMAVQLISEEASRLKLIPPVEASPERDISPPEKPSRPALPTKEIFSGAISVLSAIAMILSVRLVLLLSWAGAFTLAVLVVVHPTTPAIVAMVFYDLLGFVPVVVLSRLKG